MSWTRHLEKLRKLAFGLIGLGFLAWGLWFVAPEMPAPAKDAALSDAVVAAVTSSVVTLYGLFKDGVWLIVGAVILGNGIEHLSVALRNRGAPTPPPAT